MTAYGATPLLIRYVRSPLLGVGGAVPRMSGCSGRQAGLRSPRAGSAGSVALSLTAAGEGWHPLREYLAVAFFEW